MTQEKKKTTPEEEEIKRKKALGIRDEKEMQEIENESRRKAIIEKLKKSASAKGSVGAKAKVEVKIGRNVLNQPGGKRYSKIIANLEALIEAGVATKEQVKRYEQLTGKKAPKSEIED